MKHSYFINDRIRLRAMEPEDLELIYEMENDPQQWDISNFTVPYSRYVMKQYLENSQCDMFADKQLRMMIVRLEDGVAIGTIDITDFAPIHARGEVGIVIRKEFRGAGYAKDALTLLCEYAFDFLYLKQLIVHVATDNEHAPAHFLRFCAMRAFEGLAVCRGVFQRCCIIAAHSDELINSALVSEGNVTRSCIYLPIGPIHFSRV